jgi:rare lipoprotein A
VKAALAWLALSVVLVLGVPAGSRSQRRPVAVAASSPIVMTASWYGYEFKGKPMANGHRFNPEALTVAHQTLPLGTRLYICNPETKRCVYATVEDRGPYCCAEYKRQLDCSLAVARRLGFVVKGVTDLEVWVL